MAENLLIATESDKPSRYKTLIPQLEALTSGETDITANLANIAAALKQTMNFFWVGFYLVKDRAVSRTDCLHTRWFRKGCMWYKLERKESYCCPRCGSISRTHCLQFGIKI